MLLSPGMLTSTCTVLSQVAGPADELGQGEGPPTWADDGPAVPCAHFPAGTKLTTQAQLKGVRVAREVYLGRAGLNPQTHRLRLDGVVYEITLVNDWPGYTVLGVTT